MEPQAQAKDVFFLFQAGILAGVVLIFLWKSSRKGSESQFGMREADRDPTSASRSSPKPALDGPQGTGGRPASSRPKPAQLEGIRLDAPPNVILGIPADASRSVIQKAYRDQMKRYHPDLVGPPGSREWKDAQAIAEAINRAKEEMLKRTRL